MTRSVRDSALVLQAIAGYDPLDPSMVPVPIPDYSANLETSLKGIKVGIPTNYYFDPDTMDDEVEASIRKAITALEGLGMELREVAIPSMQYIGVVRATSMADSLVTHEPYIKTRRQDYSPHILYRALAGQFVLGRDYSKALKVQRIIKEDHARVLQEVDFLVTPTVPVAAPRIDAANLTVKGTDYPVRGAGTGIIIRNMSPQNTTGLPAISVPCGFTRAGLPVGLQLIGRPFEEELLFRVAHNYEAVSPSQGHRPNVPGVS
jgi:aspartyl-tRNA(Asn)/glutamyl-tRNA(Gln) amidotransferase subunit A